LYLLHPPSQSSQGQYLKHKAHPPSTEQQVSFNLPRFLINLNNHKCLPSYHRRGFKYLRLFNSLS
jgi:hypothetical protein